VPRTDLADGRVPRPAVHIKPVHAITACRHSIAASMLPILITDDAGRPCVSVSA
jgi:hypothetical protein